MTSTEDILEELDLTGAVQRLEIKTVLAANDEESRLLALLSHEPVHIDELSRQSSLTPPTVASTLMMLDLKGWCDRWVPCPSSWRTDIAGHHSHGWNGRQWPDPPAGRPP